VPVLVEYQKAGQKKEIARREEALKRAFDALVFLPGTGLESSRPPWIPPDDTGSRIVASTMPVVVEEEISGTDRISEKND